jgi:shikimate kinase
MTDARDIRDIRETRDVVVGTIPDHNLILTGSVGARLLHTGKIIANSVDTQFFNLEAVVQEREGRYPDELRKLYGEAYARRVEVEICREFTLRRGAVVTVPPSTLLDDDSRDRLLASGTALVLTSTTRRYGRWRWRRSSAIRN